MGIFRRKVERTEPLTKICTITGLEFPADQFYGDRPYSIFADNMRRILARKTEGRIGVRELRRMFNRMLA